MYTIFEDASGKTVRASGDMMTGSAEELRTTLLGMLRDGVQAVRFDLSSVRNMDAVSLAVLVGFADMVQGQYPDISLEIILADRNIIDLFRLSGLDQVYRISA